jgi:hypothetical protein
MDAKLIWQILGDALIIARSYVALKSLKTKPNKGIFN